MASDDGLVSRSLERSGYGQDGTEDLLDRIDPELAVAFEHKVGIDLTDITRARDLFRAARAGVGTEISHGRLISRVDTKVPGLNDDPPVRVRRYSKLDQPAGSPCLLWIHGGGHVVGTMEQDDYLAEQLVEAVGCVVVSVEWRKAPEHPYPSSLNDCYAALAWIQQSSATLGVDSDLIAVGGASSGGGSAAGLALLARDRGEVSLCYQLLTYPMLDDRNLTPSSHAVTHPRLWNRATNIRAWEAYLGNMAHSDAVPPYAAPSRAYNLAGLPPAFIAVGELDLFLDEDIDYAQRLLRAGVQTELHVYSGAVHGFDAMAPSSGVALRLIRDRTDALSRAFSRAHQLM